MTLSSNDAPKHSTCVSFGHVIASTKANATSVGDLARATRVIVARNIILSPITAMSDPTMFSTRITRTCATVRKSITMHLHRMIVITTPWPQNPTLIPSPRMISARLTWSWHQTVHTSLFALCPPVKVCQSPEGRVVQGVWTALRLLERLPTFPARRALPQTLYYALSA